MAELPKSGVSLVVENAAKAIRDLTNFTKAQQDSAKAAKSWAQVSQLSQQGFQQALGKSNTVLSTFTKSSAKASPIFNALSGSLGKIGSQFLSNIPIIGQFSGALTSAAGGATALGGSMSLALPIIGAATVAIGLATAGFAAFYALGSRGASLQPVIDAFGNLSSQFGNSTVFLRSLREQTKGTVSDMELMRIATFALSGASQELGQVFFNDLGKNLNDVGRLAVAMGRSPVEAQNRWIDALKKGERELLDELGIIVSATEANKKYAESIGKTATELTAYERTAAFAREASLQLNEAVAKLPEQSGVLVTLQRIPVLIRNTMDKIALAIQPVFEPFVSFLNVVINSIEYFVSYAIPLFATGMKIIGSVITELQKTFGAVVKEIFGGFSEGAGTVLPYVVAAFQLAGEAIVTVIRLIGSGIRAVIKGFFDTFRSIGNAVGDLFGNVGDNVNLNINQLAYNLGYGGAAVAGAFATGLIRGGTFVLKAVTQIAQIVADFLMGFSPPKRGVLHNIDKGAENVAVSWVEGFTGGISKSFGEVTAFVNDRLGAIAFFTRDQIEGRLAQLDFAIRPFKESLEIIKADMQAIAGFTDPALKIMERQRQALLKAFGRGESGLDIERLREQDRQIANLKELKNLSQDKIDQAELELSLAEAQQAQERALLNIAKNRLGVEENVAKAAEKAAGGAGSAGGGGGGGGSSAGTTEEKPFDFGGGAPDLLSNEAIDAAKQQIIATISGVAGSFTKGIGAGLAASGAGGALAAFNTQTGELQKQLGRIKSSDPVQAIADKFSGLKERIESNFQPFIDFIQDTFKNLFGDPDGSVIKFLEGIKTKFNDVFGGVDIQSVITTLTNIKETVSETLSGVFDFDVAEGATNITDLFTGVFDEVKTFVDELDASSVITDIKESLKNVVSGILDDLKIIDVDSVVSGFEEVLGRVRQAIESFPTDILNKGKEIVDSIAGALGRGGDQGNESGETVAARRGEAQNVLEGVTFALPDDAKAQLGAIGESITSAITLGMVNETSLELMTAALDTLYTSIKTRFDTIFTGEESILGMAITSMTLFIETIAIQLEGLQKGFDTTTLNIGSYLLNLFENSDGVIQRLPLLTQGAMDAVINQFMRLINEGEGTLSSALMPLTDVLKNAYVRPFHRAAQAMADSVRNGISRLLQGLSALLGELGISLPTIPPIYVEFPQLAKGALNARGSFIAGERGAELITTSRSNPFSVFPARATAALEQIGRIMEAPAAQPMYITPSQNSNIAETNTNYTNSNNRNVTQNFRYAPTKLERAQMRAGLY